LLREQWRGCDYLGVLLSLVYRLVRCLVGLPAVLVRSDLSKDAELLVLRHENQVLRRQLAGRLRWDHADRLWLAALSRLGHTIAAPTVWEILHAAGIDPAPRRAGPTWRQFLAAQAHAIIACDFLVVETVLLQRLYVLVFIEHGTRRLHLAGVTARPTGTWAAQQARNLAMDLGDRLGALRFLVHDRDPVFTTAFGEVFRSEGLRIIATLPKTPGMNAVCERVSGTLRRELLDRILILGERRLALVLREYVSRYNGHRPHQSRRQRSPDMQAQPVRDVAGLRSVRRKRVVAGVINEYHHAA